MNIQKEIKRLIDAMSEGIWEKEQLFSLSLLSSIAGESIFLLGPPGTGKSAISRRLKAVFKDGRAFEYLMSRFSTPDEIFGPVSIRKLKDEDCYERCTDGYLASADIVFLDEIWKAGPAIQNALLTAINERIFLNGSQTIQLPMKILVAASNELPKENEGLEALWDRFLVRAISNCIENETAFYKMMQQHDVTMVEIEETMQITDLKLASWRKECRKVHLPDDIMKAITYIRSELKRLSRGEGVEPLDYYISDRRWKKIANLLQTSAYLNNRMEVNYTDLLLLFHTIWNKTECMNPVANIVVKSIFHDLQTRIESLSNDIREIGKEENTVQKGLSAYKVSQYFYTKLIPPDLDKEEIEQYFFLSDYGQLSLTKTSMGVRYYDEKMKGYIIRLTKAAPKASQLESLFNNLPGMDAATSVKLRRGAGSVIVDDVEYLLERSKYGTMQGRLFTMSRLCLPNIIQLQYEDTAYAIRQDFDNRKNMFINNNNLFVSPAELEFIKRHCQYLEKLINAVEVKVKCLRV